MDGVLAAAQGALADAGQGHGCGWERKGRDPKAMVFVPAQASVTRPP